ncbi:MAG TPA: hypothetical protein VHR45_18430 [Thermoanaerobaculia bacterium]|nr:hypothetical protein [Thermoanaerobaculia bacterium]
MWVRIDDSIAHHPKFVRAGPEAFALFVAGLCYCNRYETAGRIAKAEVPHLLPGLEEGRAMELALRLAANGAQPSWVDEGDHFSVHDYELFQLGRDEGREEARRAQNAERQRRFRERGAGRGGRGGGTGEATGDSERDIALDGNGDADGDDGAVTSDGNVSLAGAHSPALAVALGRPGGKASGTAGHGERQAGAEFEAWFDAYPRQEGELRARQAWAVVGSELPALAVLLERLEAQRAAKPEASFWPAAERYLRERRWRDRPPLPAGAGAERRPRSADAERRALGSDPGRRQRLREISEAARFDPEAGNG